MLKRVVLLNGPAGSGKDALAHMLVDNLDFCHLKVTGNHKERVHALYGMPDAGYDYFEGHKDEKRPEFYGLTPRQAYIRVWEDYFKPMHGENFLIDELISDIDNSEYERFVVSDIGFDRECKALINYYALDSGVFKIMRPGIQYDMNDTRSYVSSSAVELKVSAQPGGKAPSVVDQNRSTTLFNQETLDQFYNNFIRKYQKLFTDDLTQPLNAKQIGSKDA